MDCLDRGEVWEYLDRGGSMGKFGQRKKYGSIWTEGEVWELSLIHI